EKFISHYREIYFSRREIYFSPYVFYVLSFPAVTSFSSMVFPLVSGTHFQTKTAAKTHMAGLKSPSIHSTSNEKPDGLSFRIIYR
ncbi:MAG: hypothetical protein LBS46_06300, partial [Dysgonamonadaceae bacterium]|nr:hypothetical protein [Dysgonamonadaceae bacterium]